MKSEKYIAKKINYPDECDIEKYPTLSCALWSIIWNERARNVGGWCD